MYNIYIYIYIYKYIENNKNAASTLPPLKTFPNIFHQ